AAGVQEDEGAAARPRGVQRLVGRAAILGIDGQRRRGLVPGSRFDADGGKEREVPAYAVHRLRREGDTGGVEERVALLDGSAVEPGADGRARGERAQPALERSLEIEGRREAPTAQIHHEASRACGAVEETIRRAQLARELVPGEQERLVEVGVMA